MSSDRTPDDDLVYRVNGLWTNEGNEILGNSDTGEENLHQFVRQYVDGFMEALARNTSVTSVILNNEKIPCGTLLLVIEALAGKRLQRLQELRLWENDDRVARAP